MLLVIFLCIIGIVWTISPILQKGKVLKSDRKRLLELNTDLNSVKEEIKEIEQEIIEDIKAFRPETPKVPIIVSPAITLKDEDKVKIVEKAIEYETKYMEKHFELQNQKLTELSSTKKMKYQDAINRQTTIITEINSTENSIRELERLGFVEALGVRRTAFLTILSIILVLAIRSLFIDPNSRNGLLEFINSIL
jgi:hypothetical protein